MDNEGSVTGAMLHPTARKARLWVDQTPGTRTPHYPCVYGKTWFEDFVIE